MASNYDDLYSSPRAVVDLRLLQVDEEKLLRNLDYLRTPLSLLPILAASTSSAEADAATEQSLPPLNSLSICSSLVTKNDDSSSVSSVSLEDGDSWEPATAKRSIFASYWNKKGGRPMPVHAPRSCARDDSKTDIDSSMGDHSYENLLEKHEAAATRRESDASIGSSSGARRRRLWDNRYVAQSEPALNACVQAPLRKTQSASAVGPRRSCLRKGRFSSSEDSVERRSSGATLVSFNEDVQVQFLKPVTENWASKGWSKYFM